MSHQRMLSKILCLDDFELAARRHLPKPLFGYVSGATETNASLRANRECFGEWAWVPRSLVNVSARSTTTELFGRHYAAPFGIAPMGICALTGYRGDINLATAAQEGGIPMIMSSSSLIAMEDVIAQAPGSWFQAYLPRDEQGAVALVERVARSGFEVLVVTVDSAVVPNRENNTRNGFKTPLSPNLSLLWDGLTHPRWAFGTFLRTMVQHGMPHFENVQATRGAPLVAKDVERDFSGREHLDWNIIRTIRKCWRGPLVLKGILHWDDALQAQRAGADGIIVSNHGGRQLDGAIAPLQVIERICDAVGKELTVMADSGFRRGTDVLKALALGARCVFIGRPFNYASAIAGRTGVSHAIQLMKNELRADMGLLGVVDLAAIGKEQLQHLRRPIHS